MTIAKSPPQSPYRFAPASDLERFLFGAAQPDRHPQAWLDFMQSESIRQVCCLLEEKAPGKYWPPG